MQTTMRFTSMALVPFLVLAVSFQKASAGPEGKPMVSFGPEVLVSDNADGGALRCEPSAALQGKTVVVAWNDSSGGKLGSMVGVRVAWSMSRDGGRSFTFGGYLPTPPQGVAPSAADSWLAGDGKGSFFLSLLELQPTEHVLRLYRMDSDTLGKWQEATVPCRLKPSGADTFLDKPALAVSPDGMVGLIYSRGSAIHVVLSADNGKSWGGPITVSETDKRSRLGSHLVIHNNTVVAAWAESGQSDPAELWMAVSTDRGRTFSKPGMIYKLKKNMDRLTGYTMGFSPDATAKIITCVWLAALPGEAKSRFFLTCAEGTPKGSNVLLFPLSPRASFDASPKTVGRSSPEVSKVFPCIAAVGKYLAVAYYDRRENPDSALTDVYVTVQSPDSDPVDGKMTTVASDWKKTPGDKRHAPVQRNFGDYITIYADGSRAFVVWTDGRSGAPRIMGRSLEVKD